MRKTQIRAIALAAAIVLLLTSGIGLVVRSVYRSGIMEERFDALKTEARIIASSATTEIFFTRGNADRMQDSNLKRQADVIAKKYNACIAVTDPTGKVSMKIGEKEQLVTIVRGRWLATDLQSVMEGQEIATVTEEDGGQVLLFCVPMRANDRVVGAVVIRTGVQTADLPSGWWAWLVLPAVIMILLLSAVILLSRRAQMKPLRRMADVTRAMAAGDFSVRMEEKQKTPEFAELAVAFNSMAESVSNLERTRREFVANVSHELRSPITSIAGFLGGMEDGTIPAEEHPRYLALVNAEVHRLSALVAQLLALSRLERDDAALEYSDFDICEMLNRAVIRRVNDLESKHMDVDCQYEVEPCMVHADSGRIEQVLVNLMDNAIRFTPEGGKITLTCDVKGDTVEVRVRDNGVGILPEDRPRVFERFFTADRAHTSGKGTGLGLAISRRIMEMHKQSIVLEDGTDDTSFMFTLQKA